MSTTDLERLLDGTSSRKISGEDCLLACGVASRVDLTVEASCDLCERAELSGVGIEPDARFGGPAIRWYHDVVIFRIDSTTTPTVSDAYRSAVAVVAVAAALSACDGRITAPEERHLERRLEAALHLSDYERKRLQANLQWLVSLGPIAASLGQRVKELARVQRREVAEFMVSLAAADGVIHPNEVTLLLKVFRVLELEEDDLYERLNALSGSVKREWEVLSAPVLTSLQPNARASQRRRVQRGERRSSDPPSGGTRRTDALLELLFADI